MDTLSHFAHDGRLAQVDVGAKDITARTALAQGRVSASASVITALKDNKVAKGDAFTAARLAGIMAAKRTAETIPLCHQIDLDRVDIEISIEDASTITLTARAQAHGRTGVEMEALCAVSAACLTIYDMCKSMDKSMTIGPIMLLEKSGGKSGPYKRT
ncbi:MAG: cyclic pyranopterin monophosphate synthase MoaC [Elusimicrobiota bacterium]